MDNAPPTMSLDNLKTSLYNLKKLILEKDLGGKREVISVQYVGGEVSVLDMNYVEQYTKIVKEELSPLFNNFQHGVQSNLICSEHRLKKLAIIFNGNIGTSIDNFTQQRQIKNSSSKYQTIFLKNKNKAKRILGRNVPGVIVIDEKMSHHIHQEIALANKNKTDIVLRPAFQGGSSIERFNVSHINLIYQKLFKEWFLTSKITIEPFYTLAMKRINSHLSISNNSFACCPFQRNCTKTSLNIEPNGDIYLCVEMADGQRFKMGNLITNHINHHNYDLLGLREKLIDPSCLNCKFFQECQGGCMNESWEHTGNLYKKSFYCEIWFSLFSIIDDMVKQHTAEKCYTWLVNLQS